MELRQFYLNLHGLYFSAQPVMGIASKRGERGKGGGLAGKHMQLGLFLYLEFHYFYASSMIGGTTSLTTPKLK